MMNRVISLVGYVAAMVCYFAGFGAFAQGKSSLVFSAAGIGFLGLAVGVIWGEKRFDELARRARRAHRTGIERIASRTY